MLVSLQGKIYLAQRDQNGRALKPVWVGNAPTCELQLNTETSSKTDSYTGSRLEIGSLDLAKTATLNLTLDEYLPGNLALGLYGTQVDMSGGTVTGEALPADLTGGDYVRLDHPFVSDVELSTGDEGTDWRLDSAAGGIIEILGSGAANASASYTYDDAQAITVFTARPPERWLYLDGINTATGEAVLVDLYRVKFNPVGTLGLIHEQYGNLPLTGSVLYDTLNAGDANLGGYGRMISKAAA